MMKETKKEKGKYNLIVIGITAIVFLGIFIFYQVNEAAFMGVLNTILNFLYDKLGWFFNLATLFTVIVCLYFMLSKYGKIKIGGPDAKPEFSTFTWWAISLTSGMGMGIVFWPPAEVIEYSLRPAVGLGLESGSYRSVVWAMEQTMMHWSITLYAVYTMAAIMAVYVFYNMKKPFSVTSTLYPAFGDRVYKYRSWIDGIIVFAMVGGVAGSFGYGIMQVSDSLNQIVGTPKNTLVYIIIAAAITLVAIITSVTGLKKGIQWLGDNNAKMFIILILFVCIFGPLVFSLNLGVESTGNMVSHFFNNMTLTEPTAGTDKWSTWWNWLWYIDFFIFAPITGLFLARLGKGRTLRQFITVNLVAPGAFCLLWVWIFGGLAAHAQMTGLMDLGAIAAERGTESVMISLFDLMPLSKVMKIFMMIIVLTSFITMVNADINTISKMSIKNQNRDEEEKDPPRGIQIFWGLLIGGVSLLFILAGGIDGAKSVKLLVGIPIVFVEVIAGFGFLRMFVKKKYVEAPVMEPEAYAEAREADEEAAKAKAARKSAKSAK